MASDMLHPYCEFEFKRQMLMGRAKEDGKKRAADDYPYAVYRDKATVERIAAQAFQDWFTYASESERVNKQFYLNKWRPYAAEGERLYRAAWIAGYEETVAKKDEAARPKVQPTPQPQPAATPATPSNIATLQGATLAIKSIDPGDGEMVYTLEINHPGVTNGVEVMQLGHPISNATSTSSYGYAASFSDATTSSSTRLGSSSGVVPLPSETSKQSGFSVKKSGQFYIK